MPCELTISEVVKVTGGQCIQGSENLSFRGIGTDTRVKLSDQLFIALTGDNFDAHKFLEKAIDQDAKALLIHKKIEVSNSDITIVLVDDTLKALQDLANFWRKKNKIKVLAISGSNGKTTSKEFAKSILSSQFKVTASEASFNNHWGVPLTLLRISAEDNIAIIEMGMNHLGELKLLSQIAEQDVSVVTTIGRAHMGEVGSFAEIIKAKKELYDFSPNALHIFNLDNRETNKIYSEQNNKQRLTFSCRDSSADVFMQIKATELNQILVSGHINGFKSEVWVPIFGAHNVVNLMVASALSLSCGMKGEDIWAQLSKIEGAWGRGELKSSKQGFQVIFDAYNANPESVNALIENIALVKRSGKKYFVFGDMLELGADSEKLHLEVIGKLASEYDGFWYIGQHSESIEDYLRASKFEKTYYLSSTYEEVLAMKFHSMLNPEDLVLIKGSRGMKLEQTLEAWDIH